MSSDGALESLDGGLEPGLEPVLEPVLEPGREEREDGLDRPRRPWRGGTRAHGPMAMRPAASSAITCFLWRLRCRKRLSKHLQQQQQQEGAASQYRQRRGGGGGGELVFR